MIGFLKITVETKQYLTISHSCRRSSVAAHNNNDNGYTISMATKVVMQSAKCFPASSPICCGSGTFPLKVRVFYVYTAGIGL